MPSTFSTNLGIELITTGEQAGTWGATTNTNLGTLIEQAISGYVAQVITDGADTVITIPSGSTGVARNMTLELTGALSAARNLIVPSNRKLYFIYNNTTGGYAVTVKVSGQTGVSVPNGAKVLLVSNGTDVVSAVNYIPTLYFPAGTAAAPSISTIGDTNTGIYFPAADKVAIATGGTQRVIVDDLGNVGIGISSPAYEVDASGQVRALESGTGSGGGGFVASTAGANGNAGVLFQTNSASRWNLTTAGTNGANLRIYNYALASDIATFDSSGNLGIGTSSPGAKLQVTTTGVPIKTAGPGVGSVLSDVYITRSSSGTAIQTGPNVTFEDGTTNNSITIQNSQGNLTFWNYGAGVWNERLRLDSSGNLGLGVTPSAWVSGAKAFQAGGYASFGQGRAGTSDLVASWNAIVTSGTSSGTGYVYRNTGDVASSYEQNGQHRWYTAPSGTAGNAITFTQAMTLDASGNLGVGETAPSAKLDLKTGSVYLRLDPAAESTILTNGATALTLNASDASSSIRFRVAGAERMRLDASGNLTVGPSTSNTTLTAAGNVSIKNTANTSGFDIGLLGGGLDLNAFIYQRANGYLAFGTNNTERARITSGGDLLIGTTTSAYKTTAYVSGLDGFCVQNSATGTGTGNGFIFGLDTNNDGLVWSFDQVNIRFGTNNAERARIDSSGNLGLGVTPSAWGNGVSLQGESWSISRTSGFDSSAFATNARQTAYGNGAQNWVYRGSAAATNYEQYGGAHSWYTAPSGTAGNAISFTQAMTLDASGNLLVGTTSTAGSQLNTTNAVVGKITSHQGTVSATNGTATTMFSITAGGGSTFLVTVSIIAPDTGSNYTVLGLLRCAGTNTYTNIVTSTTLTVALSGTNLQATQNSGLTQTINWSILRLL